VIKAAPEDFLVEERIELPRLESGAYRVYLLTKSGWTTPDLVRHLARVCGVSPEAIAYGGKKDKHGLTRQFVTIRDGRDFSRKEKAFALEARGFLDRPLGPDLLRGNAFRITVRNLRDAAAAAAAAAAVRSSGVPNFFDDQRFRSYDPERGFFAEKILRRHWNGALQVYLTSTTPEMNREEKARRRAVFELWKDWPKALAQAPGPEERRILAYLAEHPKEYARALHKIPEDEISIRYSAFQSHLWNEVLRRLVRKTIADPAAVAGAEGEYLFWRTPETAAKAGFFDLNIPTAASRMQVPDERIKSLYGDLLRDKELTLSDFRTRALSRVYFKSFLRSAAVVPEDLAVVDTGPDELHPGRSKIVLSFSLPRGSYATMVIKRLMLDVG